MVTADGLQFVWGFSRNVVDSGDGIEGLWGPFRKLIKGCKDTRASSRKSTGKPSPIPAGWSKLLLFVTLDQSVRVTQEIRKRWSGE